jgi:hypothetical protein
MLPPSLKPFLSDLKPNRIIPYLITLVFFVFVLFLGVSTYKDYGLSWDEPAQLKIGQRNNSYVFKQNTALFSLKNRYYGAIYELAILRLTFSTDTRQMYLGRHLVNFLFFWIGLVGFFWLARRLFSNAWMGLLASVCLLLSPRIFADSFYNTKDIPFMVAVIFAMVTLVLFLDQPSWRLAVLHAWFSAFLIAIRIPGIFMPVLTLAFLAAGWVFRRRSGKMLRGELLAACLYMVLTIGLTILFWPILWHNPLGGFIHALKDMTNFSWNNTVLYLGQFTKAADLPWHYIPVWIAISTPLFYLAAFGFGIIAMLAGLFRRVGSWFDGEKRNYLIILACFFSPLLAVIVLHSTLYDAWRQMFFIYPPLLLAALYGMRAAARFFGRWLPSHFLVPAAALVLTVGLLDPAIFMLRYHPNENVYFNRLAGENMAQVNQRFELDYWGLSFKQGIDYILSTDPAEKIPVFIDGAPGEFYINYLLPENQKKRILSTDTPEEARYYITNYRWHVEDYPYKKEFYSVRVNGASILSVFDLRAEPDNRSK